MSQESADAETQLETLRERIRTALRDPLEEQWNEVLEQWPDVAPEEREAVRAYVSELRNRMLDCLLGVGSVEELRRGLAAQYLEIKCHWIVLNVRIQSQVVHDGRPEEALLYRATCVSLILQALEPLLTRECVVGLTDVLIEPVR